MRTGATSNTWALTSFVVTLWDSELSNYVPEDVRSHQKKNPKCILLGQVGFIPIGELSCLV